MVHRRPRDNGIVGGEGGIDETTAKPDWIASHILWRSSRGIRDAIAGLILTGAVPPGTRLPTVRALGTELGVGRSTVADAWASLRASGYIVTRQRGGTFTLVPPSESMHARGGPAGAESIDLLWAHPDPTLVPPLDDALATAVRPGRDVRAGAVITRALRTASTAQWAFAAEDFTALPGESFALRTALEVAAPSRVIAVESPSLVRTIAMLTSLATRTVPVESDAEGPLPDSLTEAIRRGAGTLLFQPRSAVPLGSTLSAARRNALTTALLRAPRRMWIIEDDTFGLLADNDGEHVSLGQTLPEQTLRITQHWRAFGPDLEVAILGGAKVLIDRLTTHQSQRGIRASGLLQEALAHQLTHPASVATAHRAATIYRQRLHHLLAALARHGIQLPATSGLFAWVPVTDEVAAVRELARRGIQVVGGRSSRIEPPPNPHIRVAITRLPDAAPLVDRLAASIAAAARIPTKHSDRPDDR